MGTRADFYVGTGPKAEWLGSIAYDGYEWAEKGRRCLFMRIIKKKDFLNAVAKILTRDDATKPEQGWPWPWDDSGLTDYAYAFEDGKVTAWKDSPPKGWPDMKARQNVTLGKRSGLLVVGLP